MSTKPSRHFTAYLRSLTSTPPLSRQLHETSTRAKWPLTQSMSATCAAPTGPPMLLPVVKVPPLRSSSLSVVLPFNASKIDLVPSSSKLFWASESFVSEQFTLSASPRALAPSGPMELRSRSSAVSEALTATAGLIASAASASRSLRERSMLVRSLLTARSAVSRIASGTVM